MRLHLQSSYAAASQRHFEKFKTENRGTEGANGQRWRHTTTCNEMFLICFFVFSLVFSFLILFGKKKKTQLRNPDNNDDHNNNEKEEQEEKPRASSS